MILGTKKQDKKIAILETMVNAERVITGL
jgi:hypothetical protein